MNRKHVAAWATYDFAGSVYSAVIASTVFQYYYIDVIVGNTGVNAGRGDIWWGAATSTSVLVVALSAPLVGAIADRAGIRKQLLVLYTAVCATAVAAFGILEPGMVVRGFLLFVIANIGFEGALVFYNAYLPVIASRGEQGRVSGIGFGVGYAGSAIGLVLAGPLVDAGALDTLWFVVAGMVLAFSLPAFVLLPDDRGRGESVAAAAVAGVRGFRHLLRDVWADTELRRFFIAFFVYIDGVLTVIMFAASYAGTTVGFEIEQLPQLFLVVQISALMGALALSGPTDRWGPRRVISLSLAIWFCLGIGAFLVQTEEQFWVLAILAGFNLGSIQAASRSFAAALIPAGKEAEMFGFYAFCGKASSIIGPAVWGIVSFTTGNQRLAVLTITSFFLIGGLLLQRVRDPIRNPAPGR